MHDAFAEQVQARSSSSIGRLDESSKRSGDLPMGSAKKASQRSASELEYHLLLAHDLHLLDGVDYDKLTGEVIEVKRMLAVFIHKLKADG